MKIKERKLRNVLLNIVIALAQHSITSQDWTESMAKDITGIFKINKRTKKG